MTEMGDVAPASISVEDLQGIAHELMASVRQAILALGPSDVLLDLRERVESLKRGLDELSPQLITISHRTAPEPLALGPSTLSLVRAREELAGRLARRIESTLGQLITNAITELDYAAPLVRSDPSALEEGLGMLRAELAQGRDELRWIVAELRQPHLLADLGLGPSLTRYAEHFAGYSGLEIHTEGLNSLPARMPAMVELAFFRIAQEALRNVHQHARARSVTIRLTSHDAERILTIQDDGQGFEEEVPAHGLGLLHMREYAQAIGGTLRIFTKPGRGTVIEVRVRLFASQDA